MRCLVKLNITALTYFKLPDETVPISIDSLKDELELSTILSLYRSRTSSELECTEDFLDIISNLESTINVPEDDMVVLPESEESRVLYETENKNLVIEPKDEKRAPSIFLGRNYDRIEELLNPMQNDDEIFQSEEYTELELDTLRQFTFYSEEYKSLADLFYKKFHIKFISYQI